MLPSGKILTIIGLVSFCSNWQFGFQITYINTASRSFYQLADEIYDQNSPNIPSSDIPPAKNVSSSERWPHLPMHQWSEEWSTIVSSFYAGALIGFILVPQLIRRVGGVRNALLCSSLPAVLGCVLQLSVRLSANNLMFDLVLSFGRLLVGIQAGCSLCLLPLFIIETSAFGHRPFLSSLQQVFQSLATLLGLVVGSDSLLALGPYKLEWLQIISLAPTLFFILFLIWLPETPFRLLEKCQTDDFSLDNDEDELQLAFERSSLFYYGSQADFCAIRDEAFNRWRIPTGSNRYRKRRPFVDNLKGLIVGTLASISFAFTADDIIDSYSAEFLNRSSNTPDASAETLTALLGLLLFISSIFGALLVDRFGRRRLLISGLLGTSLSNLFAAIGASKASAWMVTSGFAFTKAFIGFGAGAPAWFLTSELVSPLFVAQAQAISTGSLLVVTGLCTLFFLSLQGWVGSAGALLLLSSVPALIIAILLFLLLPETQELSFDQVYQLLCSHPLAGLAQHPRWSPALLRPLLLHEGEKVDADHRWGHAWELPHRAQRLMSASSYVSYGSMHSHPAHIHFTRPPLYRRHSAQPPSEGHRQQQTMQNPGDSLEAAPRNSLTRSSTFTSPKL